MIRSLLALVVVIAPAIARANNPSLAEARKAVDEIRYDEARELLVQALKQGGSSPEALVEIYRLSAITAAVLGPADLAEQYYRRMLALDVTATLPPDISPKVREPFVAAQAYMAAQPRFDARASRTEQGIQVSVVDPLRMVVAIATRATREDGMQLVDKVPYEGAVVTIADRGDDVVLVDEHGNFLRVLQLPARDADVAHGEHSMRESRTPILQRWQTWAIPAAVFGAGSVALLVDAQLAKGRHADILANDSMHFFEDAETERRRWRRHTIFGWVAAGLTAGFATTAVIMVVRRPAAVSVTPSAGANSASVLLEAKF